MSRPGCEPLATTSWLLLGHASGLAKIRRADGGVSLPPETYLGVRRATALPGFALAASLNEVARILTGRPSRPPESPCRRSDFLGRRATSKTCFPLRFGESIHLAQEDSPTHGDPVGVHYRNTPTRW